jgi:hypothetical protein
MKKSEQKAVDFILEKNLMQNVIIEAQKKTIDYLRFQLIDKNLELQALLFIQQLESEAKNERKPGKKV